MTSYSPDFIRAIPKTDLHLHLDGSLRLGTLIELARSSKVELPSHTESGLRETVFKERYADLVEYLQGFAYTCAVLQNAEALERVSYELAQDCFADGLRYIEVRYAPQLHVHDDFSVADVLRSVARGLTRARDEINRGEAISSGREPRFEFGIIACAMRMFTGGYSDYFRRFTDVHSYTPTDDIYALASLELARAVVALRDREGLPIVAFDLAGAEAGYPAGDHVAAYNFAHKHFMNKTVHAGEAYGPESIFQAITELHADRIGHGCHLFSADMIQSKHIPDREEYVRGLAQFIAERRITLEVCLTSNSQTIPEFADLGKHPFGKMLEANLSVTLCTDNTLVSNTTVCNEIAIATNHFEIPPRQLKSLIIYGFKRSFFPGTYHQKRAYVRQVIDFYEAIARRHGVDA
jgi:adenosine deaminase